MMWGVRRPEGARKDVPVGWVVHCEADKEACYEAGFIEGVDYFIEGVYYPNGDP